MDRQTGATFGPHIGSAFRVVEHEARDGDATLAEVTLTLAEVRDLGSQPNAPRGDPFTLEFLGPRAPILAQQIHRLEHQQLGTLDIFLVPIAEDVSGGIRYEAVFN